MAIEKMINIVLATDPKATASLQKLQGKNLTITIQRENHEDYFCVEFLEDGIKLTQFIPDPADAHLSGPIHAFILLALTHNIPRATALGLNFSGDLKTLEIAQQLFFSLNIDWEELTSHWTGDIAAHLLGNMARYAKQKPKDLLQKTSHMMADYITEEALLIPTRIEIERFLENVDTVKADLTRLEMRLSQLEQRVVST